jgi:BirA family biotin operon repressor/biotin-[acetyl-CoA-carboxylase] ligase
MTIKTLNSKIKSLLTILNDQAFHDGSSLGCQLGVSRTAIWKFIAQLEKYDIGIESVKGKGYRLQEPMILLDADEIKNHINNAALNHSIKIDVFSEIPSTNDYTTDIARLVGTSAGHADVMKYVCLAEMQHQGRGRLNRQWFSPFGVNLYFSSLCEFKNDIGELGGLSLIVSIAIIKTLEDVNIQEGIKIKWPNDIMFGDKKLAGILIEIIAETNGTVKAIIGIGINVNMSQPLLTTVNKPCTSLKQICKQNVDRNLLAAKLIINLNHLLSQFAGSKLENWQQEWKKYDYLCHKKISIMNQDQKIYGTALGINEKGFLLLEHQNGTIKSYSSGDASIANYE